jgi:hypothetical protein
MSDAGLRDAERALRADIHSPLARETFRAVWERMGRPLLSDGRDPRVDPRPGDVVEVDARSAGLTRHQRPGLVRRMVVTVSLAATAPQRSGPRAAVEPWRPERAMGPDGWPVVSATPGDPRALGGPTPGGLTWSPLPIECAWPLPLVTPAGLRMWAGLPELVIPPSPKGVPIHGSYGTGLATWRRNAAVSTRGPNRVAKGRTLSPEERARRDSARAGGELVWIEPDVWGEWHLGPDVCVWNDPDEPNALWKRSSAWSHYGASPLCPCTRCVGARISDPRPSRRRRRLAEAGVDPGAMGDPAPPG